MGVMLSHLEKELSSISSPKEQIAFILERHIHFYIQYFYESKCLLHERECLRGKRLAMIRKQERKYFETCRNVMNRLSRETGCRFIHPNVLTFFFFALVNWIYQWYDPKGPVSPSALAQQLITFFLRGIYGEKV